MQAEERRRDEAEVARLKMEEEKLKREQDRMDMRLKEQMKSQREHDQLDRVLDKVTSKTTQVHPSPFLFYLTICNLDILLNYFSPKELYMNAHSSIPVPSPSKLLVSFYVTRIAH